MIILDDDQAQLPKLSTLAPVYTPAVNRCTTPASSLPDYETSEAQHIDTGKWREKPRSYRRWRLAFICLIAYSLLSLIIGVPLLVVKLKHSKKPNTFISQPWSPQQASVVIPGQEIVSSPPSLQDADVCDTWVDGGLSYSGLYTATLTYNISPSDGIFLGSNGSYKADGHNPPPVAGCLNVDMNDDPSESEVIVTVAMSYTDPDVRKKTHVCIIDIYESDGVYIYVPSSLNKTQNLNFNITMLLPQPKRGTVLNVTSLATMLPNFVQEYGKLSPSIRFEQATLGGPMSTVTVESIAADNLVVMSSPGEIRGTFEASCQLVLETMSAPITANVTMKSSYDDIQPTIRLNTGNAVINASVMLITTNPKSKTKSKSSPPPSFYIDANTFNSPLSLDVSQQPLPSTVSPVFIHAGNNLGEVEVTVDKYFQGSFLVQTEYATAELEDGGIDSEEGFGDGFVASDNFMTDWAGRSLFVDASADSIVSGWVGKGDRPESSKPGVGAPGCVEVLSVLSPVELSLGGS